MRHDLPRRMRLNSKVKPNKIGLSRLLTAAIKVDIIATLFEFIAKEENSRSSTSMWDVLAGNESYTEGVGCIFITLGPSRGLYEARGLFRSSGELETEWLSANCNLCPCPHH